jgi:hypothetical protein
VHEAPHRGAAGIALTRSPLDIFVVVVCLALMALLATIMLSLYSRRMCRALQSSAKAYKLWVSIQFPSQFGKQLIF